MRSVGPKKGQTTLLLSTSRCHDEGSVARHDHMPTCPETKATDCEKPTSLAIHLQRHAVPRGWPVCSYRRRARNVLCTGWHRKRDRRVARVRAFVSSWLSGVAAGCLSPLRDFACSFGEPSIRKRVSVCRSGMFLKKWVASCFRIG